MKVGSLVKHSIIGREIGVIIGTKHSITRKAYYVMWADGRIVVELQEDIKEIQ